MIVIPKEVRSILYKSSYQKLVFCHSNDRGRFTLFNNADKIIKTFGFYVQLTKKIIETHAGKDIYKKIDEVLYKIVIVDEKSQQMSNTSSLNARKTPLISSISDYEADTIVSTLKSLQSLENKMRTTKYKHN